MVDGSVRPFQTLMAPLYRSSPARFADIGKYTMHVCPSFLITIDITQRHNHLPGGACSAFKWLPLLPRWYCPGGDDGQGAESTGSGLLRNLQVFGRNPPRQLHEKRDWCV